MGFWDAQREAAARKDAERTGRAAAWIKRQALEKLDEFRAGMDSVQDDQNGAPPPPHPGQQPTPTSHKAECLLCSGGIEVARHAPKCAISDMAANPEARAFVEHLNSHVFGFPVGHDEHYSWTCICGVSRQVWPMDMGALLGLIAHLQEAHGLHLMTSFRREDPGVRPLHADPQARARLVDSGVLAELGEYVWSRGTSPTPSITPADALAHLASRRDNARTIEALVEENREAFQENGLSALGACDLAYDLDGGVTLKETEPGKELLRITAEFFRQNFVPSIMLPNYIHLAWMTENGEVVNDPEHPLGFRVDTPEWIPYPTVERHPGFPAPLAQGEVRELCRVKDDGEGINIVASATTEGPGFEILRDVQLEDNPFERTFDSLFMEDEQPTSLFDAYERVSRAFAHAEWRDPELERFMPPRSKLTLYL